MKKTTLFILLHIALILLNTVFAASLKKWTLSPDGYGPIQVGMTLKQAEVASGFSFNSTKPDATQGEEETCYYVTLKNAKDLYFMVSDNRIVRINVVGPGFYTSTGATIGDTEAKVKGLYSGKLIVEPHKYDDKAHYLTLIDKPKDRAIRFETDGKIVTLIYSGIIEDVHLVEGCL